MLQRLPEIEGDGPRVVTLSVDWQLEANTDPSAVNSVGIFPAGILEGSAKQRKMTRRAEIGTERRTWRAEAFFNLSAAEQPYYAAIVLRGCPTRLTVHGFDAAYAPLAPAWPQPVVGFRAVNDDAATPSFRFRVSVPVEGLSARGHAVGLFKLDRFRACSMVVFSKAYRDEDRELARYLKAAGRTVVFDICDNLFYNPLNLPAYERASRNIREMVQIADIVICSTAALARVIERETGRTALVVSDPAEDIAPPADLAKPQEAQLLWYGVHGSANAPRGMEDLLLIKDALIEAQSRWPFELVVSSNSREKYEQLIAPLPLRSRYVDWSIDGFPRDLHAATAVLLPLSDNEFVKCKSHNRMTTALNAGVPVIADALEAYEEFAPFCYTGDWQRSLEDVLARPDEARRRAAGARDYILARYAPSAIAEAWEQALSLVHSTDYAGASGRPSLAD
ncbi:MAG: hypothetical protein KIS73_26495 [Enhydrobacter sp.]|nr:hypothetical protein [Enhydrobacter sp.]